MIFDDANTLVFPHAHAGVQLGRLPDEEQLPTIANMESNTQQSQEELFWQSLQPS